MTNKQDRGFCSLQDSKISPENDIRDSTVDVRRDFARDTRLKT